MPGEDLRRGLPRRPCFYTVDQVADMFATPTDKFEHSYVWLTGKSRGAWRPRFLRAVEIVPESGDWRIGEHELLRWMRYTGTYFYDPYVGVEELTEAERARHIPLERANYGRPDDTPDPELLAL